LNIYGDEAEGQAASFAITWAQPVSDSACPQKSRRLVRALRCAVININININTLSPHSRGDGTRYLPISPSCGLTKFAIDRGGSGGMQPCTAGAVQYSWVAGLGTIGRDVRPRRVGWECCLLHHLSPQVPLRRPRQNPMAGGPKRPQHHDGRVYVYICIYMYIHTHTPARGSRIPLNCRDHFTLFCLSIFVGSVRSLPSHPDPLF
jgi:hypothetical protein